MKLTFIKDGAVIRINRDNGVRQQSLNPYEAVDLLLEKFGSFTVNLDMSKELGFNAILSPASQAEVKSARSCISGFIAGKPE